ncbi:uncharacterized protein LOC111041895 [Myzus persicae]|uniref:uncharacterized protein LOC111030768 n=1 Tax=Myzus persicae TaxID=13164 RepID=UPI000B9398C9|nr:uncharacterized protein LOC111030768 [Myzus persicae]XP_022168080.1 uncharacterized protein LOC111032157 [Myzus persicae]XP_022175317.1 uncharacterized protein LOC111037218 [Myzus persicae]XP_022182038.1 uncharacterized protein LOC111041895 [Myzus persicae]
MPKIKPTISTVVKNYVLEFGEDVFSCDESVLFCKLCETKVSAERRYTVTHHIETAKHKRAVNRKNNTKTSTSQLQVTSFSKKSTFNKDLCKAMLSANIPLHKINNDDFRLFLETYMKRDIPNESTLRKNYVNEVYSDTLNKIRDNIKGNKIWVSIDETTDVNGRYVANVVIGTLQTDQPGKVYLLNTEVLDKANYSTITKLFDKSMFLLWPDGIRHDDVFLFLSDAAPYMIKAGTTIKALYSKMVHVTCLAHGMHRVAEVIRGKFPEVDKLIAKIKQIFLKAPSRTILFKNKVPDTPLPPQPIITRWGTWLEAASYYCKYFNEVKSVVQELDPDEAVSIKISQNIFNHNSTSADLAFIHSNYGFLPDAILKLENQGLSVVEAINIIQNVQNKLENVFGEIGISIHEKYKIVIEKNTGLKTIIKINDILTGQRKSFDGLPEDLTVSDLAYFKYAPLTSTDVERSFSRYKNLLAPNRRGFDFENLKQTLIVQCNDV